MCGYVCIGARRYVRVGMCVGCMCVVICVCGYVVMDMWVWVCVWICV